MALSKRRIPRMYTALGLLLAATGLALGSEDQGWTKMTEGQGLEAWRKPTGAWLVAGDARLDPKDPSRLSAVAGGGVIVNGPGGRTRNLLSKEEFGDIEAHFEFMIPRNSNSGVKLQGLYEVQIVDSQASKKLTGSDCGGIYPRAELLPRYHHLDDGYAPKVNAARPAGEWQTLDLIFKAPRFDRAGKKNSNARFEKVVLNGQVVQENLELRAPTGHAWRLPEARRGPLLLQADHGPVAFRNIRVRSLE
jgi:Domain of Unknown Function (DUF1080)